ncbi:hypothetical protein ACFQ1T_10525 [Methylophilus glucosoxydans]|uniref:Uncharacterized protein n=1 Tax=Methylophilus glucosoxydans TaxID=752553 RepID=A0ABW3GIN9_9PROT
MQWLLVFLTGLLQQLFSLFIKRYVHRMAVTLAYVTFTVGLFVAFCVLVTSSIAAIQIFAPPGLSFALGMIPSVVYNFGEIYLTLIIAKRVHDWKQSVGKSWYQTKAMGY